MSAAEKIKHEVKAILLATLYFGTGIGALLVVLIVEKGIEGRHGPGGFGGAVKASCQSSASAHVWTNIICVTGALLVWNPASVIERHPGKRGLLEWFVAPYPELGSTGPTTSTAHRPS